MSTSAFAPRIRSSHLVACLVLLAFILRALIPAGFMPTVSTDIEHSIALSFCQSGVPHAQVPDPDKGIPSQVSADNCPFGIYKTPFSGLSDVLSVTPILLAYLVAVQPTHAAVTILGVDGPPVGSRAPPQR